MVGAGAAVEEGRSEMEPVADRIRPQPVRHKSFRPFATNLARSVAKLVNSHLKTLVFSSLIRNLLEAAPFAKI